ncbi:MarR family transcriptional regulator [Novosphingobium rosa]|uniref:MarR family transcriptional regulator n=1 Tax=Novosphingobium rosa TaxID=76978 RepID=UPI0008377475|nr:MarR family transcriptional regulator [Novosphingobium rosa]
MDTRFSQHVVEAFGSACEALARAGERLALFPEPALLTAQIRTREMEALAWLEGESFNPDQLAVDYGYSPRAWRRWPFTFVLTFDRPLEWHSESPAESIRSWLEAEIPIGEESPLHAAPEIADVRLDAWLRHSARASLLPSLIASADIAASFARSSPLDRGNIVMGAMLGDRFGIRNGKLSAGGIAALGLYRNRTPWRSLLTGATEGDLDELSERARDERCRIAWLNGIAAGAAAVLGLDQRLRLWHAKLDDECARRRKSSHLRALVLLAGAGTSLTVARAADALRLSRQATTRLVAEACEVNLLREITHGNAFRRYVISV